MSLIRQLHSWADLTCASDGEDMSLDPKYAKLINCRWDTPQHVLVDDPENSDGGDVIWPGESLFYRFGRIGILICIQARTIATPVSLTFIN